MSIETSLAELERQHRALEAELAEANAHPWLDSLKVVELKRRKLSVKDQMVWLKRPKLPQLVLVRPIITARAIAGKTAAAGPKIADTTPVGAASTVVGAAVSTSGVAIGASVHPPVNSAVAPVSDGLRLIDAQLYTTRHRLW